MNRLGLIIGLLAGLYGLYKIDYILYEGLNYFGKYVFFTFFNLFVIYLFWFFYKRFNGILQIIMPLLWGVVILLVGFKIA
ncbi:MAG: hypothetical protein ABGX25_06365 [Nautiliaceae bacterium]